MAKSRVEKTRNAGTMSESAFWGFIRSALRKQSMYWKPITQCKNEARRPYKGDNKRKKWEYQCAECKKWKDGKDTIVDHITPAGSLTCATDVPDFIGRLFCEKDGLQCLCKTCHNKKTIEDNKKTKAKREINKK